MKFGRQIKSVRKFSNKQAKMYSFGAKKIGKYGVGIGDSMTKAGAATGNAQLMMAAQLVCEGSCRVGDSGNLVETGRTIRTGDDVASAVEDGIVLAAKGAEFGGKVSMLVG